MASNVVELVVRLQDKLSEPLNHINGKLGAFGQSIGALAGAAGIAGIVTALGGFAKKSLESADAIGDAADRAGVAVDTLSRLKFAAEQNDVEFGALTIAIKRWQVTLSQAASGSKDAAGALKLVGLNAAELKGLGLEEQLSAIANQFQRIRDPADQTRVAVELFGRAGEQLVPLLNKGGGAIDELIAKADELGITLDQRTATSADLADKALKRLFATIEAGASRSAGRLALAFVGASDELDSIRLKIEELKRQRDELQGGGFLTKLFVPDGPRQRAIENFNRQIDEQQRKLNAFQRAAAGDKKPDLVIPAVETPIAEATIKQRKAELEGLNKLFDEFNKNTKVQEDVALDNYRKSIQEIEELTAAGVIDFEEAGRRIQATSAKFDEAVLIDPVKISQTKVVVTQVLTDQQRAVDKFVDTLTTGLDNLAHSGELTGRSILKYLLSAFEAQVLKDAISGLGVYLKKALGGTGGASSSGIGSILSGIFGAFGHAAGGGRMSGPRIVGEDGPELDMGSGNILNRRQLAFAGSGGGGVTLNTSNVWNIDGSANPAATAQYVESRMQSNNRKLLEQVNRLMKDNYGRPLR